MQPPTITPEKRRALAAAFERGRQLFRDGRHEEAHQIIDECIRLDPANLLYVEAMLQNLQPLQQQRPASWWTKFVDRSSAAMAGAVADADWARVLQLAPTVLRTRGSSVDLITTIALAAQTSGCHDVELRYWQAALELEATPLLLRDAGLAFARQGAFAAARRCWAQLQKLDPNDESVRESMAVMGGFADPEERATAARAVESLEGGEWREYVALAAQLAEKSRFDAAEVLLGKAAELAPGEWSIREHGEQLQLDRKAAQLAIARRLAGLDDSPLAAELVERLAEDLNRLEIEYYQGRCQRYPQESQWAIELGRRLHAAAMYFEAAEQFATAAEVARQTADADAEQQVAECLLLSGESLQQVRQFERALNCYLEAEQWGAEHQGVSAGCREQVLNRILALAEPMGRGREAQRVLEARLAANPEDQTLKDRLDKLGRIEDKE